MIDFSLIGSFVDPDAREGDPVEVMGFTPDTPVFLDAPARIAAQSEGLISAWALDGSPLGFEAGGGNAFSGYELLIAS